MNNKNFYITTTLPYVNAEPHIGFALEIIEADVLARFHGQQGDEIFFNTGTDEHGLKIFRKAEELGVLSKLLEGWTGAVLAKIAVLLFIVVFIQKRPQGIFALKGRSAET